MDTNGELRHASSFKRPSPPVTEETGTASDTAPFMKGAELAAAPPLAGVEDGGGGGCAEEEGEPGEVTHFLGGGLVV